MTDQLVRFSDALAARVESTKPAVVAIRLAHERCYRNRVAIRRYRCLRAVLAAARKI